MATKKEATIAELLNIDPQAAKNVPQLIARQAFFERLAKHGVSPQDDEQALDLLNASDRLQAKRAEFASAQAAHTPTNKALRLLLGDKRASAPTAVQARASVNEVSSKVASLIDDPHVCGALLAAWMD